MINKSKIQKDAQKFIVKAQWDKAIAEYNKIVADTPSDAGTHNTIGDLYLKKNDTDNAIESYKKAADIFNRSGFTLKAIALYKKVLNIKPDQVDILLLMGKLNAERGMLGNANECYLAAATYYTRHAQSGRALDVYKTLCELNPDNHSLAAKLAELYMLEGLYPESVSKYIELAEKMAVRGEIAEARDYLGKAKTHGSDRFDYMTVSAMLDLKENRLPEAARTLEEAHATDPSDVKVATLLAEVYLRSGRYEESAEAYRKLLAMEPSNTAFRKQVIDICIRTADYESAWKEYQVLADGHLGKDELDAAEDLMKEFIEHKPDSIEARQALADIYAKTGREADIDRTHKEMADLYRSSGLTEKAANIYRQLAEKSPDDKEIAAALASLEEALPSPAPQDAPGDELLPGPLPSGLMETLDEEAVQEGPAPETDELQETGEDGLFDFSPDEAAAPSQEEAFPPADIDLDGLDELDIFVTGQDEETTDGMVDDQVIKILTTQSSQPEIDIQEEQFDQPVSDAGVELDPSSAESAHAVELDLSLPEAAAEDVLDVPAPEPAPDEGPEAQDSLSVRLSEVDILIKNGLVPMAREALALLESRYPSSPDIEARHAEIAKALADVEGSVEPASQPSGNRSVQYVEELAEADFYAQQGLVEDARLIYTRILSFDPDNEDVKAKLGALGEPSGSLPIPETGSQNLMPELPEPQEPAPSAPAPDMDLDGAFREYDFEHEAAGPQEASGLLDAALPEEALLPEEEAEAEVEEFFDLGAELRDELDPEDADEPAPARAGEVFEDSRIEEVFQEFKKGVEEQLSKEDYETHYNLGIAYKEMGMVDDAINEFKLAGKDPYKGFYCHSMLGLCYLEKGENEKAVEHMRMGLESPDREKGEYMGLKYDLADACERMGDIRTAHALISELCKEDANFRDVKARLDALNRALEGAGLRPASESGDKEGPKPVPHKKSRVSYL